MTEVTRPLDQRTIDRHRRLQEPQPPPLRRRKVPAQAAPSPPVEATASVPAARMTSEAHRLSYTVAEAVAATGLSRSRIYELIKAGDLPDRKVGPRRVIPASALRRLVGEEPVA